MGDIIIIGSKPYELINVSNVIDTFTHNVRCNINLPGNNNGTKYDKQILNVHVIENVKGPDYVNKYIHMCNKKYLINFHNAYKNGNFKQILKQNTNMSYFNNHLKSIKCPHLFSKLPRVGYSALFTYMKTNKTYVFGFSISDKTRSYYSKVSPSNCHNFNDEQKILRWLHENKHVDASLCLLMDTPEPSLDCSILQPTQYIIDLIVSKMGVCYLYKDNKVINKYEGESYC
jgi:hypothetical protein